jgi:protein CpxP
MRRILLPAALVLALSGSLAFAQQPQTAPAATDAQAPMAAPHHAPNPQHEVKHLAKALNLTPDQVAKLEPILADRDQKLEAIRSNGQLTQEDARMQMKALHKSTEQQIASVLTPDQIQQMKSMHHEHGHGAPNQAQPQPDAQAPPSV